jgi:hypothetical protein
LQVDVKIVRRTDAAQGHNGQIVEYAQVRMLLKLNFFRSIDLKKKKKKLTNLTGDFQNQTVNFVGCCYQNNNVRRLIAINMQVYFG